MGKIFVIGFLLVLVLKMLMARTKYKQKINANFAFAIRIIISGLLVVTVFVSGILLIVLGIKRGEPALIFMGVFFVLGSLAFVMGALTLSGKFDKCKIDVLGLYFGIVFIIIGIGFFVMGYHSKGNIPKPVLVIPGLMAAAGLLQTVKCIKNKK